jgi:hypothetical protein
MSNEWTIRRGDVTGGESGQFLDGVELRRKADKGYELVAVLAQTPSTEAPLDFLPFAYRGLIWDLDILNFDHGPDSNQPFGTWVNNYVPAGPPGEEDGTWTAQAGSGGLEEAGGKEDAASASV